MVCYTTQSLLLRLTASAAGPWRRASSRTHPAKEPSMTPLRRRMTEDMQLRNLSPHTQRAYLRYVALFAQRFQKSPELLGPSEIRAYQLYLTQDRQLSPSSVGIAVAALRFLYKVTLKRGWDLDDVLPTGSRRPRNLPVVMSPEEVAGFPDAVEGRKETPLLT